MGRIKAGLASDYWRNGRRKKRKKMTKSAVYQVILIPMQAVFSPPLRDSKTDPSIALEQYADALKGFDDDDLAAGWAHVRTASTRGFWPAIGSLFEACTKARRSRLDSIPKREKLNGRIVDGEYQPWGGACMCKNCAPHKRARIG